jgi:hypothetical protein
MPIIGRIMEAMQNGVTGDDLAECEEEDIVDSQIDLLSDDDEDERGAGMRRGGVGAHNGDDSDDFE